MKNLQVADDYALPPLNITPPTEPEAPVVIRHAFDPPMNVVNGHFYYADNKEYLRTGASESNVLSLGGAGWQLILQGSNTDTDALDQRVQFLEGIDFLVAFGVGESSKMISCTIFQAGLYYGSSLLTENADLVSVINRTTDSEAYNPTDYDELLLVDGHVYEFNIQITDATKPSRLYGQRTTELSNASLSLVDSSLTLSVGNLTSSVELPESEVITNLTLTSTYLYVNTTGGSKYVDLSSLAKYRGEYNSSFAYSPKDMVYYVDALYIQIYTLGSMGYAPTNTAYWKKLTGSTGTGGGTLSVSGEILTLSTSSGNSYVQLPAIGASYMAFYPNMAPQGKTSATQALRYNSGTYNGTIYIQTIYSEIGVDDGSVFSFALPATRIYGYRNDMTTYSDVIAGSFFNYGLNWFTGAAKGHSTIFLSGSAIFEDCSLNDVRLSNMSGRHVVVTLRNVTVWNASGVDVPYAYYNSSGTGGSIRIILEGTTEYQGLTQMPYLNSDVLFDDNRVLKKGEGGTGGGVGTLSLSGNTLTLQGDSPEETSSVTLPVLNDSFIGYFYDQEPVYKATAHEMFAYASNSTYGTVESHEVWSEIGVNDGSLYTFYLETTNIVGNFTELGVNSHVVGKSIRSLQYNWWGNNSLDFATLFLKNDNVFEEGQMNRMRFTNMPNLGATVTLRNMEINPNEGFEWATVNPVGGSLTIVLEGTTRFSAENWQSGLGAGVKLVDNRTGIDATKAWHFQVNAVDDPSHYHLASLTVEQVRGLVQNPGSTVQVLSELRDGHQHQITFGYDFDKADFVVTAISRYGEPATEEQTDTTTTHEVLQIGKSGNLENPDQIFRTGAGANTIITSGNTADGNNAIAIGGTNSHANSTSSLIISSPNSTVTASGTKGVIIGGNDNQITNGEGSLILGGNSHLINNWKSVIIGGGANTIRDQASAIIGGYYNTLPIGARSSVILGGEGLTAPSIWKTAFAPRLYTLMPGEGVTMLSQGGSAFTLSVSNTGKLLVNGSEYNPSSNTEPTAIVRYRDNGAKNGYSELNFGTALASAQAGDVFQLDAVVIPFAGLPSVLPRVMIRANGARLQTGDGSAPMSMPAGTMCIDDGIMTWTSNGITMNGSEDAPSVLHLRGGECQPRNGYTTGSAVFGKITVVLENVLVRAGVQFTNLQDAVLILRGTTRFEVESETPAWATDERGSKATTPKPEAVVDYDQITAAQGEDYFYYVLDKKQYIAADIKGVRNVVSFEYQLVAGTDAYGVRNNIYDLADDIDQMTTAQLLAGYTLGVRIIRTDANRPSFALVRLTDAKPTQPEEL